MFGANSMDESLKKLLPVYALVFLRALSLSITVTGPIIHST